MSEKINKLYLFLKNNIDGLSCDGGGGTVAKPPSFELYPDDYLAFATENLDRYDAIDFNSSKINELISCVSNLKKALDAQIECFLFCYGISQKIKRKNLSSIQKLEFLSKAGIFSSRTINRFFDLRNKIEHEFKKPVIKDIEALFDLVNFAILILKQKVCTLGNIDLEYDLYNKEELITGTLCTSYSKQKVKDTYKIISYKFPIDPDKLNDITDIKERRKLFSSSRKILLEADLSTPDDFTYFLKCLFILNDLDSYTSLDHIKKQLKPKVRKGSGLAIS